MSAIRKILIFFVPGRFDEALRVLIGTSEPEITLVFKKELTALHQGQGYEIFQLKRNEEPRDLVAEIFELKREELEQYKNSFAVYQALKQAVGGQLIGR